MTRIRVTVLDEDTGDTDSMVIGDGPGGYIVTCGPGCEVTDEQKFANGTVVLTIKPTPADSKMTLTCLPEWGEHEPCECDCHALDPMPKCGACGSPGEAVPDVETDA